MGIDDRDYMRERNRKIFDATYNPKEFRGGKSNHLLRESSKLPPDPPFRWIPFILLTALLTGGSYLWKARAQSAREVTANANVSQIKQNKFFNLIQANFIDLG